MKQISFHKEVKGELNEVIAQVTDLLKSQGFGVLTRIDLHTKIKEKIGKDIPPTVILGACNPEFAHKAFTANPEVTSLLPCNAVLRTLENGNISVELARPSELMAILADDHLQALSAEADKKLQAVAESLH